MESPHPMSCSVTSRFQTNSSSIFTNEIVPAINASFELLSEDIRLVFSLSSYHMADMMWNIYRCLFNEIILQYLKVLLVLS